MAVCDAKHLSAFYNSKLTEELVRRVGIELVEELVVELPETWRRAGCRDGADLT